MPVCMQAHEIAEQAPELLARLPKALKRAVANNAVPGDLNRYASIPSDTQGDHGASLMAWSSSILHALSATCSMPAG